MQTPLCVVGSYRLDTGIGPNTWRGTDLQTERSVRVCLVDTPIAMACHARCEIEHLRLVPVRSVILPQRSMLPPSSSAGSRVDAFAVLEDRPGMSLAHVVQTYGPLPPTAAVGLAILIGDALVALDQRGLHHGGVVADAILLPPTPAAGTPVLSLVGSTRTVPLSRHEHRETSLRDHDVSGLLGCLLFAMTGNRFRGVASPSDAKTLFVPPGGRQWAPPFAEAVQALHGILRQGFCPNPRERYASIAALHADLTAWLNEHGDKDPFDDHRRTSLLPPRYPTQQGDSLAAHEISWGRTGNPSPADETTLPSLFPSSSGPAAKPSLRPPPLPVRKGLGPGPSAEETGPFTPTHLHMLQEERAWAVVQPVLEGMLSQRSSRSLAPRSSDPDRDRAPRSLPPRALMQSVDPIGSYDPTSLSRSLLPRWGQRLPPAALAFLATFGVGLLLALLTVNVLHAIADRRRTTSMRSTSAAVTTERTAALGAPTTTAAKELAVPTTEVLSPAPANPVAPATTTSPNADIPAIAPDASARCIAGAFPPATFLPGERFDKVCQSEDAVDVGRLLRKALVLGHRSAGPSPVMVEWWRYGWYELAVVASLRSVCCPGAAPVRLPTVAAASECPSLPVAVTAISAAVHAVRDEPLQRATQDFAQVATCLDPQVSPPNHPVRPSAHASHGEMFERFLGRLRAEQRALTNLENGAHLSNIRRAAAITSASSRSGDSPRFPRDRSSYSVGRIQNEGSST